MITLRAGSPRDHERLIRLRDNVLRNGNFDPTVIDSAAKTAPELFTRGTLSIEFFECDSREIIVAEVGQQPIGWAVVQLESGHRAFIFIEYTDISNKVADRIITRAEEIANAEGVSSLLAIVFRG